MATGRTPRTPVPAPPGEACAAIEAPASYRLVADRSRVGFTTRHLFGAGRVSGRVTVRDGVVEVPCGQAQASIRARLDAASFDTGNGRRDRDVRGPRFLDVEVWPTIEFVGDLDLAADAAAVVVGRLSVRGVEAPLTLDVAGMVATSSGVEVSAEARIDRYALGLTRAKGMAARHVEVRLLAVLERA